MSTRLFDVWSVMGLVFGAGSAVAGVWMLAIARPGRFADHATPVPLPIQGLGEVTRPTGLVIGLSLLGVGYHLLAWSLPPDWISLRVPIAMWPVVPIVAGVSVGASLAIDRLASASDDPSGTSSDDPPGGGAH